MVYEAVKVTIWLIHGVYSSTKWHAYAVRPTRMILLLFASGLKSGSQIMLNKISSFAPKR